MKTTIVKRSQWYRGKGAKGSSLRIAYGADKGKYCCLGFDALQHGNVNDTDISNISAPYEVKRKHDASSWWLCVNEVERMMAVNDYPKISDELREKRLAELAPIALGRNMVFVD